MKFRKAIPLSFLTLALLPDHSTSQTFRHYHTNKSWGPGENAKTNEVVDFKHSSWDRIGVQVH